MNNTKKVILKKGSKSQVRDNDSLKLTALDNKYDK